MGKDIYAEVLKKNTLVFFNLDVNPGTAYDETKETGNFCNATVFAHHFNRFESLKSIFRASLILLLDDK